MNYILKVQIMEHKSLISQQLLILKKGPDQVLLIDVIGPKKEKSIVEIQGTQLAKHLAASVY